MPKEKRSKRDKSSKKSRVHAKPPTTGRQGETDNLLSQTNPKTNGSETGMTSPKMLKIDKNSGRYNDIIPHDIDVIDSRLKSDYKDKEIYSEIKEAGCFKGYYVGCGKCPQKCCVVCAPCGCGPVKTISQGEIGILIRFGKVFGKLPPGLHAINGCTDKLLVLDMRLNTIKSMQIFTTKDNLTVRLSSFGTWRITHPEVFLFKVDDINLLMNQMIAGVFCTQASKNTLDELMLKREAIEDESLDIINFKCKDFGFFFENIEFNEITLPNDILQAVSASALARRNAEAKLIEAQAEIDSAMMYKQAADQVSQNPISLQLQWLETMKDIAKNTLSTLVLPDTCIGSWKSIMKMGDGSYPSHRNEKTRKTKEASKDSGWDMSEYKEKKKSKKRTKRDKRKNKRKKSRAQGSDSEGESLDG